jgi:hypothetical protein
MQEFAYSQEKHTSIAIHTKCYRISPLPRKEPQPATWLPSQTIRYAITFYSELYQETTEIHDLVSVRTSHFSPSTFAVRFEYVTDMLLYTYEGLLDRIFGQISIECNTRLQYDCLKFDAGWKNGKAK